jgi:uncharacterized protein YcsI (UPF0317 family)
MITKITKELVQKRLSTSTKEVILPQSPLLHFKAFQQSNSSCRTGYTHFYQGLSSNTDRTSAQTFRSSVRKELFTDQTSGQAPGFVQANFVALPKENAFDFLMFCLKNPKACPILAATEPGSPCPKNIAPDADLRTDISKYYIWRNGVKTEETTNIKDVWNNDMVGFLLGCSFSWEHILQAHGFEPRHMKQKSTVPMYLTNIKNQQSGPFGGNLVVSMRPYKAHQIKKVATITGCYAGAHGSPVHWGNPEDLGISNEILRTCPDWGDPVQLLEDDIAVFWACGVTPQTALMDAKLPFAITHAPGHMFICDIRDEELRVETSFDFSFGK